MKVQVVIKFEVAWISSTKLKLGDPADISEVQTVGFNIFVIQQRDFHYLQFHTINPFERGKAVGNSWQEIHVGEFKKSCNLSHAHPASLNINVYWLQWGQTQFVQKCKMHRIEEI